jgi:5-methylcytosine-specific restriction endonuclease McrA
MKESTKLSKWSFRIRIRDGHKCFLCEEGKERRMMEAHHIYPKSLYPEKKFDLANGICLCHRCHRQIIHTSRKSWKKYTAMLRPYMRRKIVKEFNNKYKL